MARRRIGKRARAQFLADFAENGNVGDAAEAAGHNRSSFYRLRDSDPEFMEEWQLAEQMFLGDLEGQVYGWAMNGYMKAKEKTVLNKNGKVLGRERTAERVRDPRLAVRVLERRKPEWKPRQEIDPGEGAKTGVLIVPGIISSEDAFDAAFGDENEST